MANEQLFIDAYMWHSGATKEEAKRMYKQLSSEEIDTIIKAFVDNAKRCFYED